MVLSYMSFAVNTIFPGVVSTPSHNKTHRDQARYIFQSMTITVLSLGVNSYLLYYTLRQHTDCLDHTESGPPLGTTNNQSHETKDQINLMIESQVRQNPWHRSRIGSDQSKLHH